MMSSGTRTQVLHALASISPGISSQ